MDIFTISENLKHDKKFNDRLNFLSTLDDQLVNNIKKTKELPDVLINIIFQYIPKEWKVTATLEEHTVSVWSAKFSPDGRYIVTTSDDRKVKIWRLTPSKFERQLKTLL